MLTNRQLARAIAASRPGPSAGVAWWLGQLGFAIKLGHAVIYVDPFLRRSPSRLVPPLLEPDQVTDADLVCGTHDHSDHIDRVVWPDLATASPDARFVVPQQLLPDLAVDLGIPTDRFAGLDDGETLTLGSVRITGVAAAHELLAPHPDTGRYSFLGYILEADGCTVYHAGDTCIYEGLQTKLQHWPALDLAILPINGRDAERLARGCIGNMTYQEAVDLAGALRPRLVIPAHFDMFAGNTADPQSFADYLKVKYPDLVCRIPVHGEAIGFGRNASGAAADDLGHG